MLENQQVGWRVRPTCCRIRGCHKMRRSTGAAVHCSADYFFYPNAAIDLGFHEQKQFVSQERSACEQT
jgi:hypothetical protein